MFTIGWDDCQAEFHLLVNGDAVVSRVGSGREGLGLFMDERVMLPAKARLAVHYVGGEEI